MEIIINRPIPIPIQDFEKGRGEQWTDRENLDKLLRKNEKVPKIDSYVALKHFMSLALK
jgi:hypothetical protein